MKKIFNRDLKTFYILWSTQGLSQLGSSITAFALTLWLYEKTGSALNTAALTICTYVPYVLMSIFAGALSDRFDKKKTMLVCDSIAALCTILVLVLFKMDMLQIAHLYIINVFSGLMNTIQEPASEVATTLIVPKEYYQKTSGLESLTRSLVSILNPLISTALYGLGGLELVITVDLCTFVIAFISLAFGVKIPNVASEKEENVIKLAKKGLAYLKKTPLILTMILFMSGVNLIASAFDAVLPGLIIPNPKGGIHILGIVTSFSGLAMVAGSLIVSILPKPKDRIKVIYLTMLFSLGTENYFMAFSREPAVWCLAQIIGWLVVPIMSANQNVILRNTVPVDLQGRVFACRNTLQFFTIPIGLFLGGFMVDNICEPYMKKNITNETLTFLFGSGKGSGAALAMFVLGIVGTLLCFTSGQKLKKYKYVED